MSSSDSNASNNEQTSSAGRPKNTAPLTAELDAIKRSLRDRPHLVHKRSLPPVVEQVDKSILELIGNQKLRSDPEQRALVRQVLDALHVERQVYNAKLEHFEKSINDQKMLKERIAELEQQVKQLELEKKKSRKRLLNLGDQSEERAFQKEYEIMLQNPAPRTRSPRKSFEESFQYLLKFRHEFGNFDVRKNYLTPDGYKLGLWVEDLRNGKYQLDAYGKSNRTLERSFIDRLLAIGFVFEQDLLVPFENRLEQVKQYFKERNTKRIPHDEKQHGLGKWASTICQMYSRGTLDADRKKQLEELEFDFTILKTQSSTGKRKQPPQGAEGYATAEPNEVGQESG